MQKLIQQGKNPPFFSPYSEIHRFNGVEVLSCCFLIPFAHLSVFNFLKEALLSCIQVTSGVGWCKFPGIAASQLFAPYLHGDSMVLQVSPF